MPTNEIIPDTIMRQMVELWNENYATLAETSRSSVDLELVLENLPGAIADALHRDMYGNNGHAYIRGVVRDVVAELVEQEK